jgi:hypothetical protein
MSFQTFIFKIIDQLILFSYITIFLYLIMYFKKTKDEEEMEKINEPFENLCGLRNFDGDTMKGIQSMYCGNDDSAFSKFTLTFKFLYTSCYNLNLNILNFISDILKNKNDYTMSPSSHKISLIILYLIIFYLIHVTKVINNFVVKLFKIKPPKKVNPSKFSLGEYIGKSLKNNILSIILFIISISILINLIKYLFDIFMGFFQTSKLQHMFFIMSIILIFVILFTGIFNIKSIGPKTAGTTQCKSNNKYIILIFFLIIPIMTGLRQLITILFRGIYNVIKTTERHSSSILFSTIIYVVLILYNIRMLTNIGKTTTIVPM